MTERTSPNQIDHKENGEISPEVERAQAITQTILDSRLGRNLAQYVKPIYEYYTPVGSDGGPLNNLTFSPGAPRRITHEYFVVPGTMKNEARKHLALVLELPKPENDKSIRMRESRQSLKELILNAATAGDFGIAQCDGYDMHYGPEFIPDKVASLANASETIGQETVDKLFASLEEGIEQGELNFFNLYKLSLAPPESLRRKLARIIRPDKT